MKIVKIMQGDGSWATYARIDTLPEPTLAPPKPGEACYDCREFPVSGLTQCSVCKEWRCHKCRIEHACLSKPKSQSTTTAQIDGVEHGPAMLMSCLDCGAAVRLERMHGSGSSAFWDCRCPKCDRYLRAQVRKKPEYPNE